MTTAIGRPSARRGVYLREWRESRHLTQDQLAERIGTTKATISRIENGKRPYSEGYLHEVADALNCEVRDLFRHPNAPSIDDLLRTASEPVKNQARALVETLLKTGT